MRDALAIRARFGAIAPEHRGARLAVRAMEFGEQLARAMGAGFIYSLAALKIPHMQLALERAGHRILGFAPWHDHELVAPGVVKRVYEASYAKVLVPDDDLLRPDPRNPSFKARALFEVLFRDGARRFGSSRKMRFGLPVHSFGRTAPRLAAGPRRRGLPVG